VPLFLAVDMLNDSMTLRAHESVKHALFKQNARRKNEESKANGTFEHDAIVEVAKRFAAGAENNRREIRPPSGFDEFSPRLFAEDSGDVSADTLMLEFVLPGVTPGQAFTYDCRYTIDEKGTGTERVLDVFSKTHKVSFIKPLDSVFDYVASRRDFVNDSVWKKLKLEDGSDIYLSINQRKTLSSARAPLPPLLTRRIPPLCAQHASTPKPLLRRASFAPIATTG
jgi:hypothetical protein